MRSTLFAAAVLSVAPALAEVPADPAMRKLCIGTTEIEGCSQVKSPSPSSAQKPDQCVGRLCIADAPGQDQLGMEKIVGWFYVVAEDSSRINYVSRQVYRVTKNGQPARYLARPELVRYSRYPEADSSGNFQSDSSSTSCFDFGDPVSCSKNATLGTYSPQRAVSHGEIKSESFVRVVDCKEKTYTTYDSLTSTKPDFPWEKAKDYTANMAMIGVFCPKGSSLPFLEMRL